MPRRAKPEPERVDLPAIAGTGPPEPTAGGSDRPPSRPTEPVPAVPSRDADQVWRRPLKR